MEIFNIVFKCNLCNGGKNSSKDWGFNGICSKDLIEYNIKTLNRSSCSHKDTLCRKYYNNEISYDELLEKFKETYVCYESRMLDKWVARAGWDTNNRIKPRKILNTAINKLAVLTLVTPKSQESERKIFADFLIDEYYKGDGVNEEGYVSCTSEYKLYFNREEANKMKFWNFYENQGSDECKWGSGLFRYLDDEQAAQILKCAYEVKKGTEDEKLSYDFLQHYCMIHNIDMNNISEPSGANIKKETGFIKI